MNNSDISLKMIIISILIITFTFGCSDKIVEHEISDMGDWAAQNSGTTEKLNDIYGFSSSDIFAVGENGTILHYNGSSWTAMNSNTNQDLNSIWGYDRSAVYAVGESGKVLIFNGSIWELKPQGQDLNYTSVWGTSKTDVKFTTYNGIWGIKTNMHPLIQETIPDYIGVGVPGIVNHIKGETVRRMTNLSNTVFFDVWGISWKNFYIASAAGVIVNFRDGVRHDNVRNREIFSHLYAIHGSDFNNILICGIDGALLWNNGDKWNILNSGTSDTLNGVWCSDDNNYWAVGNNGTIINATAD